MKDQNSISINKLTKKISRAMTNILSERNDILDVLIENLESVVDPAPSEIFLLDSLYQLKEKILLVESRINNYVVNEKKENSLGNKIQTLYDSSRKNGTSVLFND